VRSRIGMGSSGWSAAHLRLPAVSPPTR
jgi:hypothetical protein